MNMHSKNSLGILKFEAIWKSKNITHFSAGGGLVTKSCPILATPWTEYLPDSSVHGILQARILEWAAISFSGDLPNPGIEPVSPALRTDTLPSEPPGKPKEEEAGNKPRVGINRHTLNKQDTH